MLKKNLLSIAVVTAAMSLAACADKEATTDPVEPEATTEEVVAEPMAETDAMGETDPMAETDGMEDTMATQTIAEIAAGNENLTILTAALQAAGLDTMLMEETKHTVFAPTDDAFAPVLEKLGVTKEELLANTDLLKKVLPYHVLASEVLAADIPYGTDIKTANGATISISEDNVITDATGNTANITGTDIMATNGVVHTIDAVLMPE
ncbi:MULTISPECIES: fasciclin domain-containing protein [Psychrobacter]|uniref:Putative surface protein with fasciclin (FAS1) repeats n=1 Tax=Psychrobacter fozii TaxID=198480 RepID=A0A2V4VRZ2_9GAMM|nr:MULTISPECIES: fasciclin domain-containing protein [Psychrobacter]MBH0066060.1 fasciclin domain-containing protein [Psychrobacter sp. SZ93C1]MBH0086683.1 fasciclin domain-containing protein [Psychrobacter sp. SCQQ22]PYE38084.1 putative surface protein with fasciclin (FAS1) repeats [Psychrobacter fozii]